MSAYLRLASRPLQNTHHPTLFRSLPIEPRSRHPTSSDPETSSIHTVVGPRSNTSPSFGPGISLDHDHSDSEDDERGGQTPRAAEPSALSNIFWGLGGGGGGGNGTVKAEKKKAASEVGEGKKPRSRRGTIARAFAGGGAGVGAGLQSKEGRAASTAVGGGQVVAGER